MDMKYVVAGLLLIFTSLLFLAYMLISGQVGPSHSGPGYIKDSGCVECANLLSSVEPSGPGVFISVEGSKEELEAAMERVVSCLKEKGYTLIKAETVDYNDPENPDAVDTEKRQTWGKGPVMVYLNLLSGSGDRLSYSCVWGVEK